uniref:Uncharacterized protein n=1 Tax=Physcomitrium patens TaxID=3218 RepID=A0A2K1IS68_PHYPA|nr:hypothetical protein PHYPA_026251 [Physcomitrium patens]
MSIRAARFLGSCCCTLLPMNESLSIVKSLMKLNQTRLEDLMLIRLVYSPLLCHQAQAHLLRWSFLVYQHTTPRIFFIEIMKNQGPTINLKCAHCEHSSTHRL